MGTVWLIKAEPYDPASAGTVEVLWSLGSKTPKYDGKHWRARLIDPPEISSKLFDRNNALGGGSFTPSSPIRIAVGDGGDDDDLRTYNWEGRKITAYRGQEGDAFGSFVTVFSTSIEEVRWTRNLFELRLGNFLERLRQPAALSRYSGAGGVNGGANIANKPKPRALGKVKAAEPTLIDEQALVYQINDGEVGGIDAVYSSARALSFKEDTTNLFQYGLVRFVYEDGRPYPANGGFSRDGLNFYGIDESAGDIVHWALSSAYDWSTARLRARKALSSIDASGTGQCVCVSADGTKLFVLFRGASDKVYGVNLNIPYQILSTSTDGSLDVSGTQIDGGLGLFGIRVTDDGTAIHVLTLINGSPTNYCIFQISLSSSLDITTASYTSGDYFDIEAGGGSYINYFPWGFDLSDDESNLFVLYQPNGVNSDHGISRYTLSTAADITSASFDHESEFIPTGFSQSFVRSTEAFDIIKKDGDTIGFMIGSKPDSSGAKGGMARLRIPVANSVNGLTDILEPDEYVTDESAGLLVANASPAGVIHVDMSTSGGDLDGSILYDTPGAIIEKILLQELDASEVDSASFTQIETDINDPIGYYIKSDGLDSIGEVCVNIASSVGAALRPNKNGKLGVVQIAIGTSVATINESDVLANTLKRLDPPDRIWKARVGYEYNWRPLLDSEISFDRASADDINRLRVEQREQSSETSSVLTESLSARERSYIGYYASSSDASTEAARRVTLLGAKRDIYRFRIKGQQFTRQLGETITLVHPDIRDPSGLDCLVIGITEKRDSETELEVWG